MENSKNSIKPLGKFFGERFSAIVSQYIGEGKLIGEKRTQNQIIDSLGVSRQTFQNWKRGTAIPDQYNFNRICDFFGITEDTFYNMTLEQYRKYDPGLVTSQAELRANMAQEIGLDPNLVRLLRNHIDFGEQFPVNDEHKHMEEAPIEKRDYHEADLTVLQFHKDGKLISLDQLDLIFLKTVQDELIKHAEFLFYKKACELREGGKENGSQENLR